jgi:hypothetical protein
MPILLKVQLNTSIMVAYGMYSLFFPTFASCNQRGPIVENHMILGIPIIIEKHVCIQIIIKPFLLLMYSVTTIFLYPSGLPRT